MALLLNLFASTPTNAESPEKDVAGAERLHMLYSGFLGKHVDGIRVDYEAWASDWDDLQGLRDYIDELLPTPDESWVRWNRRQMKKGRPKSNCGRCS